MNNISYDMHGSYIYALFLAATICGSVIQNIIALYVAFGFYMYVYHGIAFSMSYSLIACFLTTGIINLYLFMNLILISLRFFSVIPPVSDFDSAEVKF